MKYRRIGLVLGLALCLLSAGLYAKDSHPLKIGILGSTGLTSDDTNLSYMSGYWMGMSLQIKSFMEIRPQILAYDRSNRVEDIVDMDEYDIGDMSFGFSLDILWIREFHDDVFYLGPSYKYYFRWQTTDVHSISESYDDYTAEELNMMVWDLRIILGARHMFSPKFGIFADIGLGTRFEDWQYKEVNSSGTVIEDYNTDDFYFIYSNGINFGFVFYLN